MVSIHRILIVLYMTIRVLCFVFRFKREAPELLPASRLGGPRKALQVEASNVEAPR